MKTWLKGGLIGAVIGVIFLVLFFINQHIFFLPSYIYFMIVLVLSGGLEGSSLLGKYPTLVLSVFVFIALFFGIGAIIGLIIQKVRKK